MLKILILYDIYEMEYKIKVYRVFLQQKKKPNRSKYLLFYFSYEFMF